MFAEEVAAAMNKNLILNCMKVITFFAITLTGCGKGEKTEEALTEVLIVVGESVLEEGKALIEAVPAKVIKPDPFLAEEQEILENLPDQTWVFHADDFVPEEIACENVLADYKDGRENPTLMSLYDELPEHIYYAEYDIDANGVLDYIVVHDSPSDMAGDPLGGEVWLSREENYERIPLPTAYYMTNDSWEDPSLFMMVLRHRFNWGCNSFAVYRNISEQSLAMYGFFYDRGLTAKRVGAVQATVQVGECYLTRTRYQGVDGYIDTPVRLEIQKWYEGKSLHQVLFPEQQWHWWEGTDESWDGNDDGYEDILYFSGSVSGSGGTFKDYRLFVWSEQEGQYEEMELPLFVFMDHEKHKLYNRGQSGVSHQYYEIYGLKDGIYQKEKELYIDYSLQQREDGEYIATATYEEWGEIVEEVDVTGLDWNETTKLLEKKFPEFNFWRVG